MRCWTVPVLVKWTGLDWSTVRCVYNMIQDVSICHFAKLTNIHIQRRTYQLSRSTALDIWMKIKLYCLSAPARARLYESLQTKQLCHFLLGSHVSAAKWLLKIANIFEQFHLNWENYMPKSFQKNRDVMERERESYNCLSHLHILHKILSIHIYSSKQK